MKVSWDVIVVGAGPAGSLAAEQVARIGADVLLLDRRERVGMPVRCGELIRAESLRPFAPTDGPWVLDAIDEYRIVGPGGGYKTHRDCGVGLLLDRVRFDAMLAARAVAAGARLVLSADVVDVRIDAGRPRAVVTRLAQGLTELSCNLLVAADGVGSRIARLCGLDTTLPIGDMGATVSGRIATSPSASVRVAELHFGRSTAPGGYAWVFPRGSGMVNVGIGVAPGLLGAQTAASLLEAFVARRFGDAAVQARIAGGIPLTVPNTPFGAPGLLLAGDAARQTNPVTGAGIFTAMYGGRLAGRCAAAIVRGQPEVDARQTYERAWRDRFAVLASASRKARRLLDLANDADIDRAIARLSEQRPHRSVAHSIIELAEVTNVVRQRPAPACPEPAAVGGKRGRDVRL